MKRLTSASLLVVLLAALAPRAAVAETVTSTQLRGAFVSVQSFATQGCVFTALSVRASDQAQHGNGSPPSGSGFLSVQFSTFDFCTGAQSFGVGSFAFDPAALGVNQSFASLRVQSTLAFPLEMQVCSFPGFFCDEVEIAVDLTASADTGPSQMLNNHERDVFFDGTRVDLHTVQSTTSATPTGTLTVGGQAFSLDAGDANFGAFRSGTITIVAP
jgi:hypothetical protein